MCRFYGWGGFLSDVVFRSGMVPVSCVVMRAANCMSNPRAWADLVGYGQHSESADTEVLSPVGSF